MTSCKSGSSRTARAVCPVNRHKTDIDMLVKSFDQIVSLIRATGGKSIEAPSGQRKVLDPLAAAVVAFADPKQVAVGREFATLPGAIISFDENITPPMIRAFGIAARSRPPGSRKERLGGGG